MLVNALNKTFPPFFVSTRFSFHHVFHPLCIHTPHATMMEASIQKSRFSCDSGQKVHISTHFSCVYFVVVGCLQYSKTKILGYPTLMATRSLNAWFSHLGNRWVEGSSGKVEKKMKEEAKEKYSFPETAKNKRKRATFPPWYYLPSSSSTFRSVRNTV